MPWRRAVVPRSPLRPPGGPAHGFPDPASPLSSREVDGRLHGSCRALPREGRRHAPRSQSPPHHSPAPSSPLPCAWLATPVRPPASPLPCASLATPLRPPGSPLMCASPGSPPLCTRLPPTAGRACSAAVVGEASHQAREGGAFRRAEGDGLRPRTGLPLAGNRRQRLPLPTAAGNGGGQVRRLRAAALDPAAQPCRDPRALLSRSRSRSRSGGKAAPGVTGTTGPAGTTGTTSATAVPGAAAQDGGQAGCAAHGGHGRQGQDSRAPQGSRTAHGVRARQGSRARRLQGRVVLRHAAQYTPRSGAGDPGP